MHVSLGYISYFCIKVDLIGKFLATKPPKQITGTPAPSVTNFLVIEFFFCDWTGIKDNIDFILEPPLALTEKKNPINQRYIRPVPQYSLLSCNYLLHWPNKGNRIN